MLGMYVHTHWGYNHPYAARTWTVEDWRSYLSGLRALGYDLVMFWPLVDSMPLQPTASDRAFLERTAQVIDLAHQQFGMKFLITLCPNITGNEHAAEYRYEQRPYFVCEHKVNPKDRADMAAMLAARRWQFEPLRKADGLVIIDGDPGGYIGSTDEEFVELLKGQIEVFRQFNPEAELVYWIWIGWENYNRFWAEAQQLSGDSAEPELRIEVRTFTNALKGIIAQIPEPWSLLGAWQQHLEATQSLGLDDKRMYIPYGTIEGEPSFPLTNYSPDYVRATFDKYPAGTFPRGVMANAQTHCLQLPHTCLFAHYAQEGTGSAVDLQGFAEGLLPGIGAKIATAWEAIGGTSAEQQREAARSIRDELDNFSTAGKTHPMGKYSGLLLGSPQRFMEDLAMNLELRSSLADLGQAVADGRAELVRKAVRGVLEYLRPYQQRLGFVDAYGGPLYQMLNEPLAKLGDAGLHKVLSQFHDWRNPAVRNGVVPRLLEAMAQYAQLIP